jgi:hypothetical protein
MALVRAKLSYTPPQPQIWLKRRGYSFEHFIATRSDPGAEAKARADQVERYLTEQLASGARHTKKTLEDKGIMPRPKLRAGLASLMASSRVICTELPEELRHGGRKDYLHPVAVTSPGAEVATGEVGQKTSPTSPGQIFFPTDLSLHFAGGVRRGSGGVGEVGSIEDVQGPHHTCPRCDGEG